MPTYEQTKRDFEYLNDIEIKHWRGDDCMTDHVEVTGLVFDLMAHPTKAKARDMYDSAITNWFYVFDQRGGDQHTPEYEFDEIEEIRKRHGR